MNQEIGRKNSDLNDGNVYEVFSFETASRMFDELPEVKGANPLIWKQDFAGAWIRRDYYNKERNYGWVIVKKDVLHGGYDKNDYIIMYWENAKSKEYDFPEFTTIVSSEGDKNIFKKQRWRIDAIGSEMEETVETTDKKLNWFQRLVKKIFKL